MANIVRENIDRWFEHNLDVDNRTLYMGSVDSIDGDESGVDGFMAGYFIKGMHVLESKSKTQEITIIMNNPGGDAYHGMAIYDFIRMTLCPCTIKVYGYAMSMGSIILQAADYRVMMPNSRFMMHYGYGSHSNNHVRTIENWVNEEKRLCYEIENLYLKMMLEKEEKEGHGYMSDTLSKIINKQKQFEYPAALKVNYNFSKILNTKKEQIRTILKEMLNFDTILDAEETVALGFADEVYKRP